MGLGVAVVAGMAALGWHLSGGTAPQVHTAAVTVGPVVQAVYANGTVEPVTWAQVRPIQAARIVEVAAREGDRVEAGQVLARLDPTDQLATLTSLQANAKFLESELGRQRQLAQRGIAAPQALERAQSQLDQARAQVEAQRQKLENYVLRAPIGGMVLRRDGELGEIARPDAAMYWVGQPSPLWAVVEVDEEDIPLVKVGQRSLIKADAFPDKVPEGTVAQITPKGDPVNKSYRVRIGLPEDTPLRIGMTVEANIIVRTADKVLLVPDTALVSGGEGQVVFVVEGGAARSRPVDVGVVGEKAEIRGGLREGETVITNPPAGLADGAAVRAGG
ncbi:efflux RND transporter periplasmic adaptor subunit [Aerophototrophica crusticola]|uniref:Efflux RND transporter periplasmic adaptor subunit n=2 Tax=Aerophototrophica crusticola TaxID=1709002 RepID=A0A858RBQ8_9PROT|nr:efflux RND transporter periplasmic adaptor subunit [Rhodospirillaceae bacterium B3]